MKPIAYTVYDENNEKYALVLEKSFHYFHPDIPLRMFKINPSQYPPEIFYMQKPFFADKLFDEGYDTVLGLDSDMIVLGSLDHVFNLKGFDVGTVLNFNPLDFKTYGPITIHPLHYAAEYFNAGLVLMTNPKFVRAWLKQCKGPFFNRFQYREQDLLNLLLYFGEYTFKCLDDYDTLSSEPPMWHGLLGSSETLRTELRGKDIYIPKDDQTGYPNQDVIFKVWHPAGGQANYDKLNYRTKFPEPVVQRINEILK